MFKTAKFTRVSHHIVQQIRELIIKGSLKPGHRLPSEQKLADEFGVSKATLREAFRVLEAIGLLEIRQGVSGGAFVCAVDKKIIQEHMFNYFFFQNPNLEDFTQLRGIIEPKLTEIAANKMTDEHLAEFDEILQLTQKALDQQEFYYDLDNRFHHKIAEMTGNRIVTFVVDSMKSAIVNIKSQIEIPHSFFVEVHDAHKRIVEAFKLHDPKAAHDAMADHILQVERSLVKFYGEFTMAKANTEFGAAS